MDKNLLPKSIHSRDAEILARVKRYQSEIHYVAKYMKLVTILAESIDLVEIKGK